MLNYKLEQLQQTIFFREQNAVGDRERLMVSFIDLKQMTNYSSTEAETSESCERKTSNNTFYKKTRIIDIKYLLRVD